MAVWEFDAAAGRDPSGGAGASRISQASWPAERRDEHHCGRAGGHAVPGDGDASRAENRQAQPPVK